MKNFIVLIVLIALANCVVTSCGTKKEEKKGSEAYGDYETPGTEASSPDLTAQGKVLLESNDCKTCHHVTNKIIGPPYTEVAKKYDFTQANVSMLADKIKRGGSGTWGQIPMTPHDMSKADAEKIAMYVLSLDGEKIAK